MSSTRKKHKVFVYGTLRPRGVTATHYVEGFGLFNYYDRFPYIQEGEGTVYGNLVEVTDRQLKEFDRIEGIAHGLFKRETVLVTGLGHAEDSTAFVYVAGNVAPLRIQSGDWTIR